MSKDPRINAVAKQLFAQHFGEMMKWSEEEPHNKRVWREHAVDVLRVADDAAAKATRKRAIIHGDEIEFDD